MLYMAIVKHFLFGKTLFSRKFAISEGRSNKVLANTSIYHVWKKWIIAKIKSREYEYINVGRLAKY